MEVPQHHKWMVNRLLPGQVGYTQEFINGVKEFDAFARAQQVCIDKQMYRCPCSKCGNRKFLSSDEVQVHLFQRGFKKGYWHWTCHGELEPQDYSQANMHHNSLNFMQDHGLQQFGSNPTLEVKTKSVPIKRTHASNVDELCSSLGGNASIPMLTYKSRQKQRRGEDVPAEPFLHKKSSQADNEKRGEDMPAELLMQQKVEDKALMDNESSKADFLSSPIPDEKHPTQVTKSEEKIQYGNGVLSTQSSADPGCQEKMQAPNDQLEVHSGTRDRATKKEPISGLRSKGGKLEDSGYSTDPSVQGCPRLECKEFSRKQLVRVNDQLFAELERERITNEILLKKLHEQVKEKTVLMEMMLDTFKGDKSTRKLLKLQCETFVCLRDEILKERKTMHKAMAFIKKSMKQIIKSQPGLSMEPSTFKSDAFDCSPSGN